jgi:hypothetical protein
MRPGVLRRREQKYIVVFLGSVWVLSCDGGEDEDKLEGRRGLGNKDMRMSSGRHGVARLAAVSPGVEHRQMESGHRNLS